MEKEIWKELIRSTWKNQYKISNHGNVLRYNKKLNQWTFQKLHIDGAGYYYFKAVHHNGKQSTARIHGMVCELFKGDKQKGMVPDHIDEDKLNNHVSNLRWLTIADNTKEAAIKRKQNGTQKSSGAKRINQLDVNGNVLNIFPSITKASEILNISHDGIWSTLNGRAKSSGGYIWEYAD